MRSTVVVVVVKRTDVNGHGVGHRARTTHRSLRGGRARRDRTAGSRRDRRRRFDERRRTHPRQTLTFVGVKLGTTFYSVFIFATLLLHLSLLPVVPVFTT